MITRRNFIETAGVLTAAPLIAQQPKRIAIVTTIYRYLSHGQHMGDRFLVGYPYAGVWQRPNIKVVSLYVDQKPEGDLSADRAKEFGFTVYPTIAETLRAAGLGDEFVYRGAVDRAKKIRFFHDLDVLSVPSGYHEPKGLYLLEAMACGVPVVQPNHGAFPEILARTGGGVLAKSESGADIADAIFELWKDPARAAALGRAGAEGVRRHYTVQHMAEGVLKAYVEAGLQTRLLQDA